MRIPSCIPLVGIGLTIAGCGSSESPAPEALLFTVNGARQPVVFPGDTAVWGGFGFGTEPGAGVLVSATGGLAPAQVLSWSDGAIQGVLPEDAASGPTYVQTATDSLGPRPGGDSPSVIASVLRHGRAGSQKPPDNPLVDG